MSHSKRTLQLETRVDESEKQLLFMEKMDRGHDSEVNGDMITQINAKIEIIQGNQREMAHSVQELRRS